MKLASYKSWLEAPKSLDMKIQIRKFAFANRLVIKSIYSKSCHDDLFDRLLGIEKETVFFDLEGDLLKLNELKRFLESLANE